MHFNQVSVGDELPQHLCYLCATVLRRAATLKATSGECEAKMRGVLVQLQSEGTQENAGSSLVTSNQLQIASKNEPHQDVLMEDLEVSETESEGGSPKLKMEDCEVSFQLTIKEEEDALTCPICNILVNNQNQMFRHNVMKHNKASNRPLQ